MAELKTMKRGDDEVIVEAGSQAEREMADIGFAHSGAVEEDEKPRRPRKKPE